MNTYLIADPHINHFKIIEYCNRPFKTVEEMNKYIIEKWNSVVKPEDLVWVLGDFGFGSRESLKNILNQLNGTKYLVMGNHDRRRSVGFWLDVGFNEVFKKPVALGEIVLSHEPKEVIDKLNVHGHIHNTKLDDKFSTENHICVSVECINYAPIRVNKIVL